ELLQKKDCVQEEYERELSAAQEYYDKLSTLKIKANRKKDKCSQPSTGSTNSSSSSGIVTAAKQKLREIELVKFDGDPRNWLTFWTRFMESAFPADLIKFWERQRGMSPETTGKSDLELLIDFLKREVEIEFKLTRDVLGSDKAAEKRIQWKFNPPSSVWWGGWWERLIQIVKQILRKVLGRVSLSYEELLTVLCDCERIVNSRPLTYVPNDIEAPLPLTPEKILHETPQSGVPDIDNVDKEKLSRRAKYHQRMRELLRVRFRSKYLGQLRQQSTRNYKNKPLSVGEIVLLEDQNKSRAYWNLARVIRVIPGRNGSIRVARVKSNNSEFLRPIQRLFRLELDNIIDNTQNDHVPFTTSSGRVVKSRIV
ncbi:uncharacterized protein LOC118193242, partial [Stegodyphus dumicola]|uniref:uncharacterized protein LOC118193242 n=1 Tax=Stegodyphus dumicola TaxID=202533 RepID=UPI0015B074CC